MNIQAKITANGETHLKQGNPVLSKKMCGIYKITNKINGRSYVGMSNDILRRIREHSKLSHHVSKTVLSKAIKKYGVENFEYEILELCAEELLPTREIYYIGLLMPKYNMTIGGQGVIGLPVKESVRKILKNAGKKQWEQMPYLQKLSVINNNLIGPRKGHAVSKETRQKLKDANLNKKQNAETIKKRSESFAKRRALGIKRKGNSHFKKVFCVETGMIFNSVNEAGEYLGVNPSSISAVVTGRYKTCKGYTFKFFGSVETMGDECSPVGARLARFQVHGNQNMVDEIVHSHTMEKCGVSDKGLLQLAIRSGQYRKIHATSVYADELVAYNPITGELKVKDNPEEFKQRYDGKSQPVGYYARLELHSGFVAEVYMTTKDIEFHGKRFSKSYASKTSPWQTDFDAMAEKTVLKQLLGRYGILSIEMQKAFVAEEQEEQVVDCVPATTVQEAEEKKDKKRKLPKEDKVIDVETTPVEEPIQTQEDDDPFK